MSKSNKTPAEFYLSELEFQKAQKQHAEQEIQNLKRWTELKVKALHKEIDLIDIAIHELQKIYDQEREAEQKYGTPKPKTL